MAMLSDWAPLRNARRGARSAGPLRQRRDDRLCGRRPADVRVCSATGRLAPDGPIRSATRDMVGRMPDRGTRWRLSARAVHASRQRFRTRRRRLRQPRRTRRSCAIRSRPRHSRRRWTARSMPRSRATAPGLSPMAQVAAYWDWASHLAFAPGKRLQLAEKGVKKSLRLGNYVMRTHAARWTGRRRASSRCRRTGASSTRRGASRPSTRSTRASC